MAILNLSAYRAGELQIRRFGERAEAEAEATIAALRRAGDSLGAAAWIAVLAAIRELRVMAPGDRLVH